MGRPSHLPSATPQSLLIAHGWEYVWLNCGNHPTPPSPPDHYALACLPGLWLARRHGTGWGVNPGWFGPWGSSQFGLMYSGVWCGLAEPSGDTHPSRGPVNCASRATRGWLSCHVPRHLAPDIDTFSLKPLLVNTFRESDFLFSFSSWWLRILLACRPGSRCGDCLPKWIPRKRKKERVRERPQPCFLSLGRSLVSGPALHSDRSTRDTRAIPQIARPGAVIGC